MTVPPPHSSVALESLLQQVRRLQSLASETVDACKILTTGLEQSLEKSRRSYVEPERTSENGLSASSSATQSQCTSRLRLIRDEICSICDDVLLDGVESTPNTRETDIASPPRPAAFEQPWPLANEEYLRYGRQLILPEVGLRGQQRLKAASVLIVGAGGLGCPAACYLAGAGVGKIGIVDGDTVEVSNLHRQILHSTDRVGMKKVDSAIASLKSLNPNVKCIPYAFHLAPENAPSIFRSYDVILDCTDHPTSRYLISDAAVILRKTLVSASALRLDGQLMTLNKPPAPAGEPRGGPCYRCIFPKPPPADSVISCGEGGILGPVVGVMGVLQALETITLIASGQHLDDANDSPRQETASPPKANLLIFSANASSPFKQVRLRGRREHCPTCSSEATVTEEAIASGSLDYSAFCGVTRPVDVLQPRERISAERYARERGQGDSDSRKAHLLIDVREQVEFELCSLPDSINIPYSRINKCRSIESLYTLLQAENFSRRSTNDHHQRLRFICRYGNDSQLAIRKIQGLFKAAGESEEVCDMADVAGGFAAWQKSVDSTWPQY